MNPTAASAICFSSWQSKISKKKNTMSEGGKMIPNYLSFLSPFSVFRGWPKYFSSHTFDTKAGAIKWDDNTGVMLSGKMSISS